VPVAGYSQHPLVRKLGIKPDSRVLFVGAPTGLILDELPAGTTLHRRPTAGAYETILLFCPNRAALERGFGPAAARLTVAGGLWTCWPKKSSGVATDLTENDLRTFGLASGLVDVKVCAVDDTWSGLRWVRRLADR
jgi:hypothetical protein